jgi:hypothetical protein
MKLLLVGCEYAGTTTLAHAIDDWMEQAMGTRLSLIHDHWKIPYTIGHSTDQTNQAEITEEEEKQFLALSSRLKDNVQRHNLYYHTPRQPSSSHNPDKMVIGMHIEDGIYGPHYFGYGLPGDRFDRRDVTKKIEHLIVTYESETVLVLVKASPEVIARRMKESPHRNGVLQEKDIEFILDRFEQEYRISLIANKITLDTSASSVERTVAEFVRKMEPYFGVADRLRMVSHRGA